MWQFKKWHKAAWIMFLVSYNMCITYKLGSGVGLSQNFRHSPSPHIISVTFCNISCPVWKWRFDNWHTTPYEMCHLPNCHNTSCGSCASVLEWIYLSRHTPDAQSIPSMSVMSSRTYVNLDVYVHMIAHISTRCKYMCVCWQSRLDDLRRSRLDSHAHAVYEMLNDDESLD